MGEKITIQLIDWRPYKHDQDADNDFKIEKVTNTTKYIAGEFMPAVIAENLCAISGYEIKIRAAKNSDF